MSVPPKYAGLKLLGGAPQETQHTLENILRFSAKMFNTFYADGPTVAQQYISRLQVIFRQQIQPWHPSSTLIHEAGAAFSAALFQNQAEFFDVSVVNETRNKTCERLARIAGSVGVDEQKVLALLVIPDTPNSQDELNVGNQLTNGMKWMTKANRVIGVHVTPTIFFNGVEERGINSSFTAAQ
ncbi:hypothetical protein N7497_003825 [Penicillium chrysogenum]|nr:hypothetical protein N7497_003825 [Penicillium chrysogenum]